MIVECPRCKARYRVDDDVVAEEPTFKCSRCDHLFGAEAAPSGTGAPDSESEPTSEALSSEPDPEREDADLAFDAEPEAEPEPDPEPPARGGRRRVARAEPGSLDLPFATSPAAAADEVPDEDAEASEAPEIPEVPEDEWRDDEPSLDFDRRRARDEDVEIEPDVDDVADEDDEMPAARSSSDEPRFVRSFAFAEPPPRASDRLRRPFLVFLAVLLLFYGNLALYFRNHPETTERALAGVPLFGRVLAEDRLLQSRVYLRDLEGVFQRVKDGRTVFIVSGRAVNTADTAVRGVEVESALYDAGGAPVESKSIFCGNAMSLKIVKDLSSKEITILQRLQPPQRFEIAPGDAAGFSVVFLDPPAGFVEFSARVASAQPALS